MILYNSFERISEPNHRKKLHCEDCKRATIHTREAGCVGRWYEEHPVGGHIDGGTEYSLYRCGACDQVCFEKSSWFSEEWDHDVNGEMYLPRTETQFPAPTSASFVFNTSYTPKRLDELIEEMMYAFAGGKMRLSTVGLRMVIEFIVNDKGCSGRNLMRKIENLGDMGLIDQEQIALLQRVREKGNAGAHEGVAMSPAELVAGLSITDLLIEKLYSAPAREAEVLKAASNVFDDL